VPPGFQFHRLSAEEKQKLTKAVEGFRYVSTHVPWTSLHYFSPFDNIAEFSIRQVDIALEASAFLGAEVVNIHAQRAAHLSQEQSWPTMIRRFRRWGDFAKASGFRLAIETGYLQSVRDFVRFIEEINHSHVGATIDVGHQKQYTELLARVKPEEKGTPAGIKAYNDINHELIGRLGSKLFHFHVHDIEPGTWAEHKPLIHGFIDYPRLIKKLRKTNYQGLLIFEIGGATAQLPAILRNSKQKLEAYLAKN
jgi:sugar phosphate isomerase/epimerase